MLLFLVGGGIGQVILFTTCWAFATRIDKPLLRWWKTIRGSARRVLAGLWPAILVLSSTVILFALEIALLGLVPGVTNPDAITQVMLASLGTGLVLMVFAFVSGYARDIEGGLTSGASNPRGVRL